jgi:hypothetical protein
MPVAGILRDLSVYARVMTAVLPFLVAVTLRLIFGSNRVTRVLISLSTVWFTANILIAPYSQGMLQDIFSLRDKLR